MEHDSLSIPEDLGSSPGSQRFFNGRKRKKDLKGVVKQGKAAGELEKVIFQ